MFSCAAAVLRCHSTLAVREQSTESEKAQNNGECFGGRRTSVIEEAKTKGEHGSMDNILIFPYNCLQRCMK